MTSSVQFLIGKHGMNKIILCSNGVEPGVSNILNLFIRYASTNSICKFDKRFVTEGEKIILPNGDDGQFLIVGDHCLFSDDIFIQTADDHTIVDNWYNMLNDNVGEEGENRVEIGDHVWLGHHVCILRKGRIGNNVVVGACDVGKESVSSTKLHSRRKSGKNHKTNVNWNIKSPSIYKGGQSK